MAGLGSELKKLKSVLLLAAGVCAAALLGYGCAGVVSATSSKTPSPSPSPSPAPGGSPLAQLAVSPTSAVFQNVVAGSSTSQTVTVSNSGTAQATISQIQVSGAGFSVTGLNLPAYVQQGQNVRFSIVFSPSAAGNASGSVSVVSDASNSPITITANGSAVTTPTPALSASTNSVSFGNVTVGSGSNLPIVLTNAGSANVSISAVTLSGLGLSAAGVAANSVLTPGQTATLTLTYAPTITGSLTGSVSIASNAPNSPLTIAVSGTGVPAAPVLSSTASSLDFGAVVVGGTGTLGATVTNTGTANATISAVTVSGPGFSSTGVAPGMVLAPGQSAPVTVGFAPQAAGTVSGSLSVISNAPTLTILLTGNGGTASSHSVALTWDATTSDVTGYNIYRAPSDGSGPYAKLNTVAQAETQYTDSNILAGQEYMYAVTAVDSDGVESDYSDPAIADVP